MFNDEKRKFKDIVYRLETISSKIENLNTSIEDLENTFEDSLKIDDEIFEKKRIDTTKKRPHIRGKHDKKHYNSKYKTKNKRLKW